MERLLEFALNHPFLVTLFLALLMMLAWNLFGGAAAGVPQVEPSELTRLINREHAMVVDVRGEEDYDQGHILNALNIPESEITASKNRLEKARKKPLVLYCDNGTASPRAARLLKAEGFENVSCLKGGLAAWRTAGMPVTRGEEADG